MSIQQVNFEQIKTIFFYCYKSDTVPSCKIKRPPAPLDNQINNGKTYINKWLKTCIVFNKLLVKMVEFIVLKDNTIITDTYTSLDNVLYKDALFCK